MPTKDGTGPTGKGPMTGRGCGQCLIPLDTVQEEMAYLKNREIALKEQLYQVEERLKELSVMTGGNEQ